jgi:hypothetical protein
MPSNKVHRYMDRVLFGKSYWKIHDAIDKPWLFLGPRHRVLFHDSVSVLAIAEYYYPGDKNAEAAALYHVKLDFMCSSDPALKAQLEFLAEQDGKRRRKRNKTKNQRKNRSTLPPEFRDSLYLSEKMVEIRRLANVMRS